MASMDKLMLWGALAVMAVVGSLSVRKVSQTPRIDPEIAQLEKDYRTIWGKGVIVCPPEAHKRQILIDHVVKEPARSHDWTAFIATKYVGIGVPHPPVDVFVLPFPVVGEAKTNLDGTTITWTLQEYPVELRVWMTRKPAEPAGFVIQRQCEDGPAEEIARLGPKERSFTDLSTEARLTYRYWVLVTGNESVLTTDPPLKTTVTKGLNTSAETRTPSATRLKLVGGDKGVAFLRVETYDRTQKKWIGKLAQVAPGREVGSSGWTLKGLRFENFTLVADLTDDEGVDRVLNTKN